MHDSRLRVLGSNPGVPVESVKFVVSGFFPLLNKKSDILFIPVRYGI